jgi:hypothetical protein
MEYFTNRMSNAQQAALNYWPIKQSYNCRASKFTLRH